MYNMNIGEAILRSMQMWREEETRKPEYLPKEKFFEVTGQLEVLQAEKLRLQRELSNINEYIDNAKSDLQFTRDCLPRETLRDWEFELRRKDRRKQEGKSEIPNGVDVF